MSKAAVLYRPKEPMVVEEIDVNEPKAGEVMIKLGASGICRSDYHIIVGEWSHPLPVILGHEAAGTVAKVGPGVTSVKPGDPVIISFRPSCGVCQYCTIGRPVLCQCREAAGPGRMLDGTIRFSKNGQPIYHFATTSSFSEYSIIPESSAVPVRPEMPMDKAALVGCSVTTGVLAVFNTAKVEPGSNVVVIGTGGVGLNCIQGAKIAGAAKIIAVDMLDSRLDFAQQFGASHSVNAAKEDPVQAVRRLTGDGADFSFDAFGSAKTTRQAYDMIRSGGTCTIVGMAPDGEDMVIPARALPATEKTIKGSYYGSVRPRVDMPKLVDLYLDGKLKLDELVTATYTLDEINEGFAALERGEGARGVIVY